MLGRKSILGVALVVPLTVVSCGSGDDGSIDREEVKANYVAMAYAVYQDSLEAGIALQSAVNDFVASPTEDNLSLAKAAYKQARVPYQQSEVMRWDTAITLEADLASDGGLSSVDDWEGQVNAWPLDENHIVSLIEGDQTIDQALLISQNGSEDNEANVTTGVHAVEFMLWGEDTNGVNPGSGMRPATDFANDDTCVDAYCARRAAYLQAAMNLLVDDLTAMVAEWSPEASTTPGTLAHNFLTNDSAIDYILGSIRAMATDELASARMGSGLELGDPEEEHDCFSDLSHVAIYYNFQGVRNAFYGTYENISGPSLADIVSERDRSTFVALDRALNSIEVHMAAILTAGELEETPIRFDQIIGQEADGAERVIAETAVDELVGLEVLLRSVQELLSLEELPTDGSGDGD